jgi:hypothetical protein
MQPTMVVTIRIEPKGEMNDGMQEGRLIPSLVAVIALEPVRNLRAIDLPFVPHAGHVASNQWRTFMSP